MAAIRRVEQLSTDISGTVEITRGFGWLRAETSGIWIFRVRKAWPVVSLSELL